MLADFWRALILPTLLVALDLVVTWLGDRFEEKPHLTWLASGLDFLSVLLFICAATAIVSMGLRVIARSRASHFWPLKFLRPREKEDDRGAGPLIVGWVETGPEYWGRASGPPATSLPLTRSCLVGFFLGLVSAAPVLHFQTSVPWLIALPIVAGGIWAAIWEMRAATFAHPLY